MRRKNIVNALMFIAFLAGLFFILYKTNFIMRNKEYSGVNDYFGKLPRDSVDIVFIGNSHQFCSISPEILLERYDIESFMLATSAQTVPMSYYAAMEAIELQHPSKIVFEVSYCANDFRTVTEEMSHCFFDGMPLCKAKFEGIKDLIEPENRIYYYLPLGLYHSRWKELKEEDFSITAVSDRGGVYYEDIVYNPQIPVIDRNETESMPEEMEKYMDMLVDICNENNVELIMYVAPFNTLYEDEGLTQDLYRRERIFNYVGEYAHRKGIAYYNLFYNLEELGLDGMSDWKDRQHLNHSGQEKLTDYMADKFL